MQKSAQAKKPILEKLAKKNLTLASGGDRKSENYKNQGLSEMIKVDYKQEAANKMNASIGNNVSTEICENVSPIDTQKEIAKVAGVSHDTILDR